ncbi:MAG: dephospho-CoA kinase [Clostridia bacterium]|nr:dephospho-CoA kinase [Clostridia bacterium]
MKQNKPNIIGIMGTIGSGKTAIAHIMSELGAYVINADIISREVLLPESPASLAIRKCFGSKVMIAGTNVVNRKALAQLVFADADALTLLNGIMHPIIRDKMHEEAENAFRIYGYELIVFDAPLLVEAGLHVGLSDVWLVTCSDSTRIERIMKRDRTDAESARARINARASDEYLAEYATVIIQNDGSLDELKARVTEEFIRRYGNTLRKDNAHV